MFLPISDNVIVNCNEIGTIETKFSETGERIALVYVGERSYRVELKYIKKLIDTVCGDGPMYDKTRQYTAV